MILPVVQEVSDYWVNEELQWDIARKEAIAILRILKACSIIVKNAWDDVQVDNQAVINSWNHQGGKSSVLTNAIKKLFFTTVELNISLHLSYVPSNANPAGTPSRKLSAHNNMLSPALWQEVQQKFGGIQGQLLRLNGIGF